MIHKCKWYEYRYDSKRNHVCCRGQHRDCPYEGVVENNHCPITDVKIINKKEGCDDTTYSALEYESLRDEAWNMAHTLKDIEEEVKKCAMCGGREDCGYSSMQLLKELCYIFQRDIPYHRNEKYTSKGTKLSED